MSSPPTTPSCTTAHRRRPAWAGRNYTLLTGAAVVTNLGSHGALIASAFAVLEAGGSGGDVGLVAAARTLPLVLFLLIGGALADRLPRHRVMVAANALNCVSQAAFAVLVLTGHPQLWQMMLLTALCGTGTAFFNPAAEGMLLSSVSGEHANRAFALFRMAMNGAGIGGAALGGAMIAAIGPGWVLAVPLPVWGLCAVMFVSGTAVEVFGVNWMTTCTRRSPRRSSPGSPHTTGSARCRCSRWPPPSRARSSRPSAAPPPCGAAPRWSYWAPRRSSSSRTCAG